MERGAAMWHNFKRNWLLIWIGLNTLSLGVFFIYVSNFLADEDFDHARSLFTHFEDPDMAILLVIVGVTCVLSGLWHVQLYKAQAVSLIMAGSVWSMYLVTFVFHDLHTPGPINFSTMYAISMLSAILMAALTNTGWGGGCNES